MERLEIKHEGKDGINTLTVSEYGPGLAIHLEDEHYLNTIALDSEQVARLEEFLGVRKLSKMDDEQEPAEEKPVRCESCGCKFDSLYHHTTCKAGPRQQPTKPYRKETNGRSKPI